MGIRSEGYNAEQSLWLETFPHGAPPTSSKFCKMYSNRKMRIIKVDRENTITAESKGQPANLLTTAKLLLRVFGEISAEGARPPCENSGAHALEILRCQGWGFHVVITSLPELNQLSSTAT